MCVEINVTKMKQDMHELDYVRNHNNQDYINMNLVFMLLETKQLFWTTDKSC